MGLHTTEHFHSSLLSVRFVACRADNPRQGELERNGSWNLILPVEGAFQEHFSPTRSALLDPCSVLLLRPGQLTRISHPAGTRDACLVLDFSEAALEQSASIWGPPEDLCHGQLSPAAMVARDRLWHRMRLRQATATEVEETGLSLLSSLLRDAAERRKRPSAEPALSASARERVEEARLLLLQQPERAWSLAELAMRVGASPFHLTRMFRRSLGLPLHRYLLHQRLARALDFLLRTDRGLSAIAAELGFSSHSHFSAVFRRLTGSSPATVRREAAAGRGQNTPRNFLTARAGRAKQSGS
jgi:AraC-like DNA-binding protein